MEATAPNPTANATPGCPGDAALDPRIRRTREQLQQALARLLETHAFDRLSINEITAAAGVNRATFYAHYADKFALLECVVAARFMELLAQRGVAFHAGCDGALRGLVMGVCDFLDQSVCPKAVAAGAERPFEPHMEHAIVAVLRRMVLRGLQEHAGVPPGDEPDPCDQRRLRASAIAWAIFGAAREWAAAPRHVGSEEVAASVVALLGPLLSAAAEHAAEPASASIAPL